jgi:hypothetical protein
MGFQKKHHLQKGFNDNMSRIHVFIKEIVRDVEKAYSPPPSQCCEGCGVVMALFSLKQ